MRTVYLIRHGPTAGNEEKRYVGSTDEPLSATAFREIEERSAVLRADLAIQGFGIPKQIFVSPMLRCRQTAKALFPESQMRLVPDLREKHFGEFEYKNYSGLAGDSRYQAFIDSGGVIDFPGAEAQTDFLRRTGQAFEKCIQGAVGGQEAFVVQEPLIFVVHGGSIMSILDQYAFPHRDYFDWQLKPLQCFSGNLVVKKNIPKIINIRKL